MKGSRTKSGAEARTLLHCGDGCDGQRIGRFLQSPALRETYVRFTAVCERLQPFCCICNRKVAGLEFGPFHRQSCPGWQNSPARWECAPAPGVRALQRRFAIARIGIAQAKAAVNRRTPSAGAISSRWASHLRLG